MKSRVAFAFVPPLKYPLYRCGYRQPSRHQGCRLMGMRIFGAMDFPINEMPPRPNGKIIEKHVYCGSELYLAGDFCSCWALIITCAIVTL